MPLSPEQNNPSENVFDLENETGLKVISYLVECSKKYAEAGKTIYLYQPTIEAYKAELDLVEAIKQRDLGQINQVELKETADRYVEAHSGGAVLAEWTDDVQLYYIRLFLNGKEIEAYTVNAIAAQIINSFWQVINPETATQITKL